MDIKEQIKQIISDVSCIEPAVLKNETKIKELGLDSLDIAQIMYNLEEILNIKFNRSVPFEDLNKYAIGEFLDILVERSGKKQE